MNLEQRAAYIRKQAEIQGKSQADVVRDTTLTKDTVNRIFNGRPGAGEGALTIIANYLSIVIPTVIIPDAFQEKNETEEEKD